MNGRILSPFEKTCLRWISRGRTIGEVAQLEGISVAEIESSLEHALVSLKADTIEEAIKKAGLVVPD